jgi:hypothetical protein
MSGPARGCSAFVYTSNRIIAVHVNFSCRCFALGRPADMPYHPNLLYSDKWVS